MIKRALNYFWSLRRQFAKYFIVGFGSMLLDMGTLILFTEAFSLMPVVSVVLNQAIILSANFTLNKYWSFRNRALPHKQIARYVTLAGWNYLFSVGAMYIFNSQFGFDYRLVRIGSIVLMVSWNFFLYKYWVYKEKAPPLVEDLSARALERKNA